MKRMIRLIILLVFMVCGPTFLAAETEDKALSLNEGIDNLATSLMKEIAAKYFDAQKRPVTKVAVFDFTDPGGNITVGSRYIANRIKLAFGSSPQFQLLQTDNFQKTGFLVDAEDFQKNDRLRELIVGEMRADVYIFGKIHTSGPANVECQVDLWGVKPPFDDFSNIGSLKELKEKEKEVVEDIFSPLPWNVKLSASGIDFFNYIRVKEVGEIKEIAARGNLGEVIFLSQPMCDDLSPSWQVRADGMVYDVRKESEEGTLRSRTGSVMLSRLKSDQTLKELSFIIRNFGFVVKETDGESFPLQPYIVPRESDFYFVPYQEQGTGLRFMYLWSQRGKSKKPSTVETGKGWKLYVAEQDYRSIMPVGTHTATATLEPIAESEYGSKQPRSEFVSRFRFSVKPGLNIYVINYVYRRDKPEIFVRRLEIEGTRNQPVKAIKKITEVYRVYGGE